LIFLDTETTGMHPKSEIIDIGIIDAQGKTLMDRLVRCQDGVPKDASAIHGITESMLEEQGKSFPELWPQLAPLLADHPLAIYNAEFDVQQLRQTARRYGLVLPKFVSVHCVMLLYSEYVGERHWRYTSQYRYQKLSTACENFGIEQPAAHRALADAQAAREVMLAMAALDSERTTKSQQL
jgi:DNA polymerase III epsilon subunit-like protein